MSVAGIPDFSVTISCKLKEWKRILTIYANGLRPLTARPIVRPTNWRLALTFPRPLCASYGSASGSALAHRGGPPPLLLSIVWVLLGACLQQQFDATLDEPCSWLVALGGPTILGLTVQALNWRRKKTVHATERDTERVRALRATFVEALQSEDFICLRFVDETSTNLMYGRRLCPRAKWAAR